jgi:branched-chain amino acid transport system substrate-binding protein
MRTKRKFTTRVAAALAVAVVAAACSGDDGATTETGDTGAQRVEEGAATTTETTRASAPATTAKPTKAPGSIEEWEQLWADERAAVVKKITDNKWGVSADGSTLTGPEGFTVDLSACPAGWSNTEGLTDTEIKIGQVTALSGLAADWANTSKTFGAWMTYYSDRGLFKDSTGKTRTVNYVLRDDGYDATRTIPLVGEMLDSERVFALWTLGTPAGVKVYDKINERCVPHPTLISGSPAWGDPVNHPWTTGSLLSYSTEAVIWGAFIDQHIEELTEGDGKVVVAGLVANSDFGIIYNNAFKDVIAASPNKDKIEFVTETFEITAPTVTDPMTTLAAKNPDVFITMTGGVQCTQIINDAANNGMNETTKYKFMSSVCKPSAYVGKEKVGGDGSQANGWYVVGGGFKDIGATENDDDAFSVWARQFLADAGHDYKVSSNMGWGFYWSWIWSQSLMIAGELPGGLTRANFLLAQRAFEGTSPVHLQGIKINMNGNADAYFLEGSDLSIWDSAAQAWVVQGEIIELSGKSGNCAWDTSVSACR